MVAELCRFYHSPISEIASLSPNDRLAMSVLSKKIEAAERIKFIEDSIASNGMANTDYYKGHMTNLIMQMFVDDPNSYDKASMLHNLELQTAKR